MKKLLIFLLITQLSFAQIGGEDEVYLGGDRIEATFNNGGIDKFYDFINANFNFSTVSKTGKMITTFTVNERGEIKDIRVTQFLDIESATEIIRVLKVAPNWKPATKNGKPISVTIKIPLDFNVIPKKNEKIIRDSSIPIDNQTEFTIYNLNELEKKPEYTGGINSFYEFIGKNFNTPDVQGLSGKIMVTFVVEKDGSLTDIKVLKDIGYGTGQEAIRVLKKCPKWKPAQQKGIPVRCSYSLPISIVSRK